MKLQFIKKHQNHELSEDEIVKTIKLLEIQREKQMIQEDKEVSAPEVTKDFEISKEAYKMVQDGKWLVFHKVRNEK